jgi:uncharacterized protein YjeT (DUF2065 family)
MPDFVAALGLVLVIEGLLYAVVPGQMKRMMVQMLAVSDESLRLVGVAALAAGVGLVWLVQAG